MRIPRIARYYNDMQNIGYITGFVRHLNKIKKETWHKRQLGTNFHGFLLQQNNNIEHAIPVHVPIEVPLPQDKMPVTVAVHVFGETDPITGRQTLTVHSLDISRPSVRAMPSSMVWSVSSNARYADDDFSPYGHDGELINEVKEKLASDEYNEVEEVMQAMLCANRGRLENRFAYNSNVVDIAGFLESARAFIPGPEDYQENSYYELLIRQHKDRARCLPVRLYTRHMKSFKDKIKRCAPYSITGKVMVKLQPDDNGGVAHAHLYIRTEDIAGASRVHHILKVPDWYTELRLSLQKELEERQRSLAERARQEIGEEVADVNNP